VFARKFLFDSPTLPDFYALGDLRVKNAEATGQPGARVGGETEIIETLMSERLGEGIETDLGRGQKKRSLLAELNH